eukprot:jgi/Chrzof1/10770/Cz05g11170.t1
MIIPVVSEDGEVLEWGLVELQGKIEILQESLAEANFPVGTLQLSSSNKDVVQLTIGYHQLEGKRVPLKKPIAILEKDNNDSSGNTKYNVVGVVRQKYLFKTRPRALISKPLTRR